MLLLMLMLPQLIPEKKARQFSFHNTRNTAKPYSFFLIGPNP